MLKNGRALEPPRESRMTTIVNPSGGWGIPAFETRARPPGQRHAEKPSIIARDTLPVMKNKTLAAWLAFLGGPLGLHRFYLFGIWDTLGWMLPVPTALGIYGVQRVQEFGLDDVASWLLIPLAGFCFAGCALNAIVYALMTKEAWNAKFNPGAPEDAVAGQTNWMTIGAIVLSLLIGTTVLMSSIVFSIQRYFEYQIEEAQKISQ